ncbi:Pre-mRNA 3'-end-processing factor FIP1 [Bagarius yarrelli]|uniref:Pre-mRNA 3'-end-processing factor FIP1 n=1 Tax=Bagarius yarrelli TaxID=175774 RepID=A0A556U6M3_BAGYA|nr:Pre-mRNA 3'-end-processing factor FIP1 [Bagarius yarrelli]
MSTGGTEKTPGYASGDGEDWLYGENDDDLNDDIGDDDDDKKTETEIFSALTGDVEADNQDSDSDDNLHVTIGKIQSSSIPVNLRSSGLTTVSGIKVRGAALTALDNNIIATPPLEMDEEPEEKPWRKPAVYSATTSPTIVYLKESRGADIAIMFEADWKLKSTTDLNRGQTETIIRVEGRRHHSTDGSITQVQSSSEQTVDAEPPASKLPPFFPSIIPPPPFPPPPFNSTSSIIQQPPRPSLNVPPPGFPHPPEVPCPPFTSGSGQSGGSYDGHFAPPYPFAAGAYPHPLRHMTSWMGLSDRTKSWKYSSSQDRQDRDRGKDRERTREQDDRERASRHRDYSERERDRRREHDREEREREDRHRDRRHRDRSKPHKSSHSSRRRHFSDDEESHRRRRYKHSKRNPESTDTGSTD